MGFNLGVVRLSMDYLLSRPLEEREWIYVVYFYRARRKDGRIINVQQQSIPLYYDQQKIPFIFSNIFTDITFLGVRNLPQALPVNRISREVFNIDNGHMKHARAADLFSARERDIVHLLIKGLNSGQIAGQLHISPETVRTHRKNILRKAGLRNTQELIGFALTRGMT
jgi:DNA-binding CsgD family transcriptional regulator